MRAVGIKILKNKLSEYVRMAEAGETVLITDRDRVVAELRPCEASRSPSASDSQLAEAVRAGLVTPPLCRPVETPARKPVMPLCDVLAGLFEDRAER